MKTFRFTHPFMNKPFSVDADTVLDAVVQVAEDYRDADMGKAYANKLKYEYAVDPETLAALDNDPEDAEAARFIALYGIDCAMAVATADRKEGCTLQEHLVARIEHITLDCQDLDEAGRAIFEATHDDSIDADLEDFFDFARYAETQNKLGNIALHATKRGSYLVFLR